MADAEYGIVRHVDLGYEEAVSLTKECLKEQGFGVLTEINVKEALKEKIDVDFRPYLILGACNPNLAHQALLAEPDVGLLLPCNVVVYEDGPGAVTVEAADPIAVMGVVENPGLEGVGKKAQELLTKAMDALAERAKGAA